MSDKPKSASFDVSSLDQLEVGDIVQHKSLGLGFVVTANYGDRVTAVRTADITNPYEWKLMSKDVEW